MTTTRPSPPRRSAAERTDRGLGRPTVGLPFLLQRGPPLLSCNLSCNPTSVSGGVMGFDEMSVYDRTAWDACLKAVYDPVEPRTQSPMKTSTAARRSGSRTRARSRPPFPPSSSGSWTSLPCSFRAFTSASATRPDHRHSSRRTSLQLEEGVALEYVDLPRHAGQPDLIKPRIHELPLAYS